MPSEAKPVPPQFGWIDDAKDLRETGWWSAPVSIGKHRDCIVNATIGQAFAPRVWTILANPSGGLQRCQGWEGKLPGASGAAGDGSRFCLIQDAADEEAAICEAGSPQA